MARQWSSRQCNCGLGRDEPPTAGHNARLHTFGTDGTEWKQGCTRLAAGESKCMWVSWLCATRLKHIGQAVRPQARAGSTAHICPLCARYQSKRACAQCSHRHPTAAQDRKWRTQSLTDASILARAASRSGELSSIPQTCSCPQGNRTTGCGLARPQGPRETAWALRQPWLLARCL
jgi:hypothetical protein